LAVSIAFRQVKVYVRVTLISVVALAMALVLAMNYGNEVEVWFFGLTDPKKPVNVVWLMFSVMGATLWAQWVFSLGWGVWRDMRELRAQQKAGDAARALEERTARLEQQERSLDEKFRRVLEDRDDVAEESSARGRGARKEKPNDA
jgi:uncharacterized integral membrane protein